MNILILGSGAREHALCWAVKNSNYCKNLFCIPGNGGIAKIATCVKLSLVDNKKIQNLATDVKILKNIHNIKKNIKS